MSSIPTLGYWDIRGLAEPIRYLLRYAGVPFIDKRYQFGPGQSMADVKSVKGPWLPHKYNLGLDFPNLPYYIEGDLKLTQSVAILRYLARKHGLMATDSPTLAKQELVEQQVCDMKRAFFEIIFSDDFQQKKLDYISETLPPQLELLAKFLGSKDWLTVEFSYVDILAYETLDWFRLFTPETVAKFPTLVQLLARFENLGPIKAYRSSSEYKSWPLFGPIVKWGTK